MTDILRVYLDGVYSGVAVVSSHRYDPVDINGPSYISIDFSKQDGVPGRDVVFYVLDCYCFVEFYLSGVRFYFSSPSFLSDICGHIDSIRSDFVGMKCGIS